MNLTDPRDVYPDSLLLGAFLIGAFCGYVAFKAATGKTTAGALRFILLGAFGGVAGNLLGVMLVAGPYITRGKVIAAGVIGSIIGAAALCYVLRILHPRR